DLDPASLVERVRDAPEMEGADLAAEASCGEPYDAASIVGMVTTGDHRTFRVAAYDFGIKRNILRLLHAHGCDTTVFPATTPAEDVLREGFDGVFLSNGPGDPAATTYGIDACRQLLGKVPIFGICLGHQLMARALGATTEHGTVALDRWNLNDATVEGLTCHDIPAFSVQYHPEAAPGPHDSSHLFERFRELMAGA